MMFLKIICFCTAFKKETSTATYESGQQDKADQEIQKELFFICLRRST